MDDWAQIRFRELIETHRAQVGHVWQAAVGLTLVLVTVVGFAVDRQSWGLAALAVIPELVIWLISYWFRRSSLHLLDVAADLERANAGDATVAEAHQHMLRLGFDKRWLVTFLAAGIALHLVLIGVAVFGFNWTFTGT